MNADTDDKMDPDTSSVCTIATQEDGSHFIPNSDAYYHYNNDTNNNQSHFGYITNRRRHESQSQQAFTSHLAYDSVQNEFGPNKHQQYQSNHNDHYQNTHNQHNNPARNHYYIPKYNQHRQYQPLNQYNKDMVNIKRSTKDIACIFNTRSLGCRNIKVCKYAHFDINNNRERHKYYCPYGDECTLLKQRKCPNKHQYNWEIHEKPKEYICQFWDITRKGCTVDADKCRMYHPNGYKSKNEPRNTINILNELSDEYINNNDKCIEHIIALIFGNRKQLIYHLINTVDDKQRDIIQQILQREQMKFNRKISYFDQLTNTPMLNICQCLDRNDIINFMFVSRDIYSDIKKIWNVRFSTDKLDSN